MGRTLSLRPINQNIYHEWSRVDAGVEGVVD